MPLYLITKILLQYISENLLRLKTTLIKVSGTRISLINNNKDNRHKALVKDIHKIQANLTECYITLRHIANHLPKTEIVNRYNNFKLLQVLQLISSSNISTRGS